MILEEREKKEGCPKLGITNEMIRAMGQLQRVKGTGPRLYVNVEAKGILVGCGLVVVNVIIKALKSLNHGILEGAANWDSRVCTVGDELFRSSLRSPSPLKKGLRTCRLRIWVSFLEFIVDDRFGRKRERAMKDDVNTLF